MKGKKVIKYKVSGKDGIIEVISQLKQVDGVVGCNRNVWYGVATLNGDEYKHPGSEHYINAQYLADDIAEFELKKLRDKHGRSLRIKRR